MIDWVMSLTQLINRIQFSIEKWNLCFTCYISIIYSYMFIFFTKENGVSNFLFLFLFNLERKLIYLYGVIYVASNKRSFGNYVYISMYFYMYVFTKEISTSRILFLSFYCTESWKDYIDWYVLIRNMYYEVFYRKLEYFSNISISIYIYMFLYKWIQSFL